MAPLIQKMAFLFDTFVLLCNKTVLVTFTLSVVTDEISIVHLCWRNWNFRLSLNWIHVRYFYNNSVWLKREWTKSENQSLIWYRRERHTSAVWINTISFSEIFIMHSRHAILLLLAVFAKNVTVMFISTFLLLF